MMAQLLPEIEKELLLRLRDGDRQAFNGLYEHYKKPLSVNILRLMHSKTVTEDVLQDLFMRVWESREQINPELSFKSYLYRIAHNLMADLFRKTALDKKLQKQLLSTAITMYTHVEERLLDREAIDRLHAAIEELPPKRKEVYKLFKLEGKTYQEISEHLGISYYTVNDHIKKANKFLNDRLLGSLPLFVPLISALLLQAL